MIIMYEGGIGLTSTTHVNIDFMQMHCFYQGTWQNEILRFLDDSRLRSMEKRGRSAKRRRVALKFHKNLVCGLEFSFGQPMWHNLMSCKECLPCSLAAFSFVRPPAAEVAKNPEVKRQGWIFGYDDVVSIWDICMHLDNGCSTWSFLWHGCFHIGFELFVVRKSWMNGWELLALLHSGAWTGYSSIRLVCDGQELHIRTLLTLPGSSVCKLAFPIIP